MAKRLADCPRNIVKAVMNSLDGDRAAKAHPKGEKLKALVTRLDEYEFRTGRGGGCNWVKLMYRILEVSLPYLYVDPG